MTAWPWNEHTLASRVVKAVCGLQDVVIIASSSLVSLIIELLTTIVMDLIIRIATLVQCFAAADVNQILLCRVILLLLLWGTVIVEVTARHFHVSL